MGKGRAIGAETKQCKQSSHNFRRRRLAFSPLHPRLPAPEAQLMAGRWKGRKQQKNPNNPVEKTNVLSSDLIEQNGIELMTLCIGLSRNHPSNPLLHFKVLATDFLELGS